MAIKYNFLHQFQRNSSFIFIGILFLVSLYISSIVFPMQSPDESSHIARAYLLSQGQFFLENSDGLYGGQTDVGLLEYSKIYNAFPHHGNLLLSQNDYSVVSEIKWQKEKKFLQSTTHANFPLIYLPQSLGIALGIFFDFSVDTSYRLARLFTLLAACTIFFMAFKIYVPSALTLAILVLPMMLFQLSSATIDGLCVALTTLTISLFLRIAEDKKWQTVLNFTLLSLTFLLLVTSRNYMAPAVILIFALYYFTKDIKTIVIGLCTAFLIILWNTYVILSVSDIISGQHGSSVRDVIRYCFNSPLYAVNIIYNTIEHSTSFYLQAFIGILGCFDYKFTNFTYSTIIYFLICILLSAVIFRLNLHNIIARTVLLVSGISSMLCIFMASLLLMTPLGSNFLAGIQGRYFFMPILFISYGVILNDTALMNRYTKNVATLVLYIFFAFTASNTIMLCKENNLIPNDFKHYTFIDAFQNAHHFDELTQGRSFEQTFIASSSNIVEIRLLLATFGRRNTGNATLEILDEQRNIIFRTLIPVQLLENNAWFSVPIGQISVVQGAEYILCLAADTATQGNAITWWASTDAYPMGTAIVDGVRQNRDFAFKITFGSN